MRPPENDIVPVQSMDELHAGMTVWLFDNEAGFAERWFFMVLTGPDPSPSCQIHGRLCVGCWKGIGLPPPASGICAWSAIRRKGLFRLRDLDASDESATTKRREAVT